MKTLDGFGDVLEPEALYYVQDIRGVVGNCALWWGKERAGYVCDLDAAGVYTGKDVASMRDTDVPWPEAFVLANATRHVRVEPLHREPGRALTETGTPKETP